MKLALSALAISNFRGIGAERQQITGLKKINLLIGANNSGKSAFLAFLAKRLSGFKGVTNRRYETVPRLDPLDIHLGSTRDATAFELGLPKNRLIDIFTAVLAKEIPSSESRLGFARTVADWLVSSEYAWFIYEGEGVKFNGIRGLVPLSADRKIQHAIGILWKSIKPGFEGGEFERTWLPAVIEWISENHVTLPNIEFIPAIRQIGKKGEPYEDRSGTGLIDQLAEIQNPGHTERQRREIFDRINLFLRSVTDDPTATLEVPHDRENILVHMGSKLLPLEALGTGLHELIMLAAFCTLATNKIVCIEEPEIHLHPLLQRKLMKYLHEQTTNQYVIATHSAVLIDTPDAAVFHVTSRGTQTTVRSAQSTGHKHAICHDLGYRASDIAQANAVIWVEGPSDRIYLNHWIANVSPEFVEGIHYSIMFYGGRLLSHLSANDDEVTDFINLRRLNRHLAVVMDSDRTSASARLNGTKDRILQEFRNHGGVGWVTKGREIENYLETTLIENTLKTLYPKRFDRLVGSSSFHHALHFYELGLKLRKPEPIVYKDADKVKVARQACMTQPTFPLDLRKRLAEITAMVERANR